jgi:hypothetical protein
MGSLDKYRTLNPSKANYETSKQASFSNYSSQFNNEGLLQQFGGRQSSVEAYKKRLFAQRGEPLRLDRLVANSRADYDPGVRDILGDRGSVMMRAREARIKYSDYGAPGHSRRKHTFANSRTSALRRTPHRKVGIFADE